MNYLAHIYLSSSSQMQVGNFIGDFVKGNSLELYPPEIRKGIIRHRYIDHFTDTHPIVLSQLTYMRKPFGRYANILIDMYFDHLLAAHFSDYSPTRLQSFARKFYLTLWQNWKVLPRPVKRFLWHFILSNRLCCYASVHGLRSSLEIMIRYKNFPVDAMQAIAFLKNNHDMLYYNFSLFFEDIQSHLSVENSEIYACKNIMPS